MDIDAFRALIRTQDAARMNRYEFVFTLPPIMQTSSGLGSVDAVRDASLLCSSVVVPGRSVSSASPSVNTAATPVPYDLNNGEFTTTFLVDGSYNVFNLFESWHFAAKDALTGATAYLDDIVCEAKVNFLDRSDQVVKTIFIHEAWPEDISFGSSFSAQGNDVASLQVQWAYSFWKPHASSSRVMSPDATFERLTKQNFTNQPFSGPVMPLEKLIRDGNIQIPRMTGSTPPTTPLQQIAKAAAAARLPVVGQIDQARNTISRIPAVTNGIFR